VESALREVDHLQRTLTTLLQIALAESGTPIASPAPVDMAALVNEIAELFEPVYAAQDQSLSWQTRGPALVQGNRQLLAQMLTNLVENGLKYVPAGGRVEMSVGRHGDTVTLSVADNGPGIPAEERKRAAQPFVRFAASSPQEGSGLGLSLVAAIVRLHRGRLRLQDNAPGLKVVIELPA
jgi:signal transduction histidine kinase